MAVFNGTSGNDTYTGTSGDDMIMGNDGDDILNGVGGNDFISGDAGTNTIDGGDGHDTFSSYIGFDTILGGLGNDRLDSGGTGTVNFDAGEDSDGLDIDEVNFAGATTGIVLNLTTGTHGGAIAGDVYTNVERFFGTLAFTNLMTGSASDDYLHSGSSMAATIYGMAGNDNIYGGSADGDYLEGGAGADFISGLGGDNDIAGYRGSAEGVHLSLIGSWGIAGDATGDSFILIEDVHGSDHDDIIIGNTNANILSGFSGDDILQGHGGADQLIGGAGIDTASYSDADAGVFANLGSRMGVAGHATGDVYQSIENLTGSDFNDTLIGTNAVNSLQGGDGADFLSARGGADSLYGNDGNDVLRGGSGSDLLDGGAGFDTADYRSASIGVYINPINTAPTNDAFGDTYIGIERVIGSAHNDVFTGTTQDDIYFGHTGDDALHGGTGADRLSGGAGADSFRFDTGDMLDVIVDFTDGVDILDLTAMGFSTASEVIALASQAGDHTFINFGNGDFIRLLDFDLADLDSSDINIASGT